MKRRIAALLLAAAAAGGASPAAAEVLLFEGVLGIEQATSPCSILPYVEQGNLYRAAYRGVSNGSSADFTKLMIVPMGQGLTDILISSFKLANGGLNATYQRVDAMQTSSTRSLSLNFTQYTAQMRLAQQTPGDTDGADFVVLKIQVRKFGNVAGCTVNFRGILTDKSTPLL
jgi:hypothetical protein